MPVVRAVCRGLMLASWISALAARTSSAQRAAAPRYGATIYAGWHAPVVNHGQQTDRSLILFGIERRFVLAEGNLGRVSFAPELLPAVGTSHNRKQIFPPCPYSTALNASGCVRSISYSAFGAGVLPLALRLETPTARRLGLLARIDGGGVWFNERIPTPEGARFNFLARATVGVAMRLTHRGWISAGVSHLHASNAGRGEVNPGIDANLLTLGTAWR